ncbi:MAG TPA: DNA polymerase III subunit delta' [Clostridia bacterium]|nr:DNA polymerase III subunit delta' [Clostridia bacterium]
MGFNDIIGQDLTIRLIQQALKNGKVSHAYLFHGPEGTGKRKVALEFARTLLCQQNQAEPCEQCSSCHLSASGNHPDLFWLEPEGSSLKIEQVRRWQQSQAYQPYWGKWKISILKDVDKMTPEAANSLLKIIEEPGPGTVLILITTQLQTVLPTIVSRCQVISFRYLTKEQIKHYLNLNYETLDQVEKELIAQFSGGSITKARQLAEEGGVLERYNEVRELLETFSRADEFKLFTLAENLEAKGDQLLDYLDLLTLFLRDLLLWEITGREDLLWNRRFVQQAFPRFKNYSPDWFINCIKVIEETKRVLKQNANTRLALEVMFLNLGQTNFSN